MIELGNNIVNNIYERYYEEQSNSSEQNDQLNTQFQTIQMLRATKECDISIRESWIKAKYVDRKFVAPIDHLKRVEFLKLQKEINFLQDIVFDTNGWFVRQKRTKRHNIRKERTEHITEGSASCIEYPYESTTSNKDISSSSDSGSSDEDESLARGITCAEFDDFNNNMLLYKATVVHNLPVMYYALASGACKDWSNSKDSYRSPIHQAVISVS